MDGAHHPLGEQIEMRELLQIVSHQSDICGVDRDIAADSAHRDADAGGLQGGCVVDSVSDHADLLIARLMFADPAELILGAAVCVNFSNGETAGNLGRDPRSRALERRPLL